MVVEGSYRVCIKPATITSDQVVIMPTREQELRLRFERFKSIVLHSTAVRPAYSFAFHQVSIHQKLPLSSLVSISFGAICLSLYLPPPRFSLTVLNLASYLFIAALLTHFFHNLYPKAPLPLLCVQNVSVCCRSFLLP